MGDEREPRREATPVGDEVAARDTERLRRHERALSRLARETATARDLDHALIAVARLSAEALEVERASVWAWDEAASAIRCIAQFERTADRVTSGAVVAEAACPAYFAALRTARCIAADDAANDPRTRELADPYLRTLGIGAMLDAPVVVGGRLVGIVCNEHVGPPRRWAIEEQAFAGSVADHAAVAFAADTMRRTGAELRAANERLRQVLAATPVPMALYGSDGLVHLWNGAAERTFGWAEAEVVERPPPHLTREAPDVWARSQDAGGESGTMVRCVHRDGHVVEVCLRASPIAGADGVAIGTMFALQDLTKEARATVRAQVLARGSGALAKAHVDTRAALDGVARALAEGFGGSCVVRVLGKEGPAMQSVAAWNPTEAGRARLRADLALLPPHPVGPVGEAAWRGDPVLVPEVDTATFAAQFPQPVADVVVRSGLHGVLIAPLRARGRLAGHVVVTRDEPGNPFTHEDLACLQDLADRVAAALDVEALLVAERDARAEAEGAEARVRAHARRMEALHAASAEISEASLDLDHAMDAIARGAARVTAAGSVVLDVTDDEVRVRATSHVDPERDARMREGLPPVEASGPAGALKEAVLGAAPVRAAGDSPLVHMMLRGRCERLLGALDVREIALVPVFVQGRLPAVIAVCHDVRTQPVREEDRAEEDRALEVLAHRAGVAIASARLHASERLARAEAERARAEVVALNHQLEERVAERTRELEAMLAELEATSYAISHDLRTPLRAIDANAALLVEENAGLSDRDRERLARVRAATGRSSRLIDDLLAMMRVGRVELRIREVDVARVVASCEERLRRRWPGRQVEVRVAPGLVARADPGLLEAALFALLDNAWKFTSRLPVAHVDVGGVPGDGEDLFFVRDDGVGFDPTHAGSLFRGLQRLHGPEFEGVGLGLATVARIVRRHGGRVWAEGRPGAGATFWISLPR